MRIGALWAAVFAIFVVAFCADYLVLPRYDHRYRAAFFPGDRLSARDHATLRAGDRQATRLRHRLDVGRRQCRALFASERPQPRVLIDGLPDHAPWIDLADLRARGAAVVWTEGDPHVLPANLAAAAPGAEIGAPFDLPYHRGDGTVHVGWAILPPER